MSTQFLQFCTPTQANVIVGYDYMATSKDHNLDEQIPQSYPVSTQFAPIFSPSLEYHGPDSTQSSQNLLKSSVRPLAPRKGSPRRETHIPRPRNPFMIFRSEYHAQAKITTDVERDHRHISRIVGYLWNNMSEEDKAPYRLAAEKEKAEHQRKYPGYRFCPGTRTSKPVKRKVKRNGQNDLARSQKVAELLKAGLQGRDLESAIKDIDFESLEGSSPPSEGYSPSPSSSPSTQPSLTLPDVRGWQHDPVPTGHVFRSPLLAPLSTSSTLPVRPVTRRTPERPIMDSLRPDPPVTIPETYHMPSSSQPSASLMTPAYQEAYQTLHSNVELDAQPYQYHNISNAYDTYNREPQLAQYYAPPISSYRDQTSPTDSYVTPASLGLYSENVSSNVPVDMPFQYYENSSAFFSGQEDTFSGIMNEFGLYESPVGQAPDPTTPFTWDPALQLFVNM
ncbi:hypothetical protein F5890DRAFT_1005176 [Lentinula detonsa]|uniref:HMG box domain-containing protein n=1 Tax=Lentinula detonsa TaxID=2804962 RepID=A0AA38Q3P6_9AGAR|nr:hypothetical protein F5890DRAFT_1005176 [Lentinula detonsa]